MHPKAPQGLEAKAPLIILCCASLCFVKGISKSPCCRRRCPRSPAASLGSPVATAKGLMSQTPCDCQNQLLKDDLANTETQASKRTKGHHPLVGPMICLPKLCAKMFQSSRIASQVPGFVLYCMGVRKDYLDTQKWHVLKSERIKE